jgi:multidrug efflux pump subunit AcrA (membrane-fusion protein)
MGDVSSSVAASGKVVSPGDVGVSPLSSAQITSIRVKVGQHVSAGTVMATLDSTSAQTALNTARENLASDQIKFQQDSAAITTAQNTATANAPQLAQAVSNAQNTMNMAQSTYQNYGAYYAKASLATCQTLSGADIITNTDGCTTYVNDYNSFLSAQTAYNNAVAAQTTGLASNQLAIKNAQDTYNLFKISMGVNTDTPSAKDFTVDQLALANAQKNYDSMFVKAPVTGDVASISAIVGQMAPTSSSSTIGAVSGFIVLTNVSNLQAQASFSESDAAKLIVGQQATFSFAALPNAQASGKLVEVDLLPTTSSSATSYNATFEIDSKVPGLKAGMSATVTDLTSAVSNVLNVPASAVTVRGTGAFVTKVTTSGGKQVLTRTPVTLGLQGDSADQILTGLKVGDKVSLSSSKSAVSSSGFPVVSGLGVAGGIGGGLGGRG